MITPPAAAANRLDLTDASIGWTLLNPNGAPVSACSIRRLSAPPLSL
jgi:hypothetical protein